MILLVRKVSSNSGIGNAKLVETVVFPKSIMGAVVNDAGQSVPWQAVAYFVPANPVAPSDVGMDTVAKLSFRISNQLRGALKAWGHKW